MSASLAVNTSRPWEQVLQCPRSLVRAEDLPKVTRQGVRIHSQNIRERLGAGLQRRDREAAGWGCFSATQLTCVSWGSDVMEWGETVALENGPAFCVLFCFFANDDTQP